MDIELDKDLRASPEGTRMDNELAKYTKVLMIGITIRLGFVSLYIYSLFRFFFFIKYISHMTPT